MDDKTELTTEVEPASKQYSSGASRRNETQKLDVRQAATH
jgi:hypothetical protein